MPDPNSPPIPPPVTQQSVIVVVAASVGGTTNPNPGAYNYDYRVNITLQASPNNGFRFLHWIVRGSYNIPDNIPAINYPENAAADPNWAPTFSSPSVVAQDSLVVSTNPLKIICGYGYTYIYEPVFAPTNTAPATSDAIVNILNSIGGNTSPGAGTYYYLNGSSINLKATPDSGYDFKYWITLVEGEQPITINDNPTDIICGYGYTYSYQPMFAPTGSETPSEGTPTGYLYAIIVILAVIAAIGIASALLFKRR